MAVRRDSTNRLSTALRVSAAALVAAAGAWLATAAGAVQINGTRAELAWSPASGPVAGYMVFVSRNGAFAEPEQTVSGTSVAVSAGFGDVLSVSVAAVDEAGNQGPRSQASEPIEFVAPPPPPVEEPPAPPDDPIEETTPVYYEDFEAFADAEEPADWLDTKAKNSLIEDPSLFETFELTDGTVAFGTASTSTNIHSHLMASGAQGWAAYELSGLMSFDDYSAGIGVTLLSDYPNSDRYYRLRRYSGRRSFYLSAHSDGKVVCEGSQDTLVDPFVNRWYRFRFQAYPDGDGTRLRANVWEDGTTEPAGWQVDCIDPDGTFRAGRPGLWSMSRGLKLWDDLAVTPLGETTPVEDPSSIGDPAGSLYAESFEGYSDGADPAGWFDTGAKNSLAERQSLFETIALTDGTVAFGTESSDTNIHSHLLVSGGADWSAYEFSGSMSIAHQAGGIGVTLYSDYPRSDTYYRLRRYDGGTGAFHLAPHSATQVACQGTTDTGVVPHAGIWYRFRFQARPESGGTRLRARVWPKDTGEPASWQIDCLDAAGTFQSGLPGVWSTGRGIKLWDDLEVQPIDE